MFECSGLSQGVGERGVKGRSSPAAGLAVIHQPPQLLQLLLLPQPCIAAHRRKRHHATALGVHVRCALTEAEGACKGWGWWWGWGWGWGGGGSQACCRQQREKPAQQCTWVAGQQGAAETRQGVGGCQGRPPPTVGAQHSQGGGIAFVQRGQRAAQQGFNLVGAVALCRGRGRGGGVVVCVCGGGGWGGARSRLLGGGAGLGRVQGNPYLVK